MADYESLKVAELRDVLKQRGIPSTGLTRKAQIIEKLRENDAAKLAVETEVKPADEPVNEEPDAADEAELDKQPPPGNAQLQTEAIQTTDHAAQPAVSEEPAVVAEAAFTVAQSASDTTSEDSKKRKRRSATPPPAEKDVAIKKARLETKGVHLKEDAEADPAEEAAVANTETKAKAEEQYALHKPDNDVKQDDAAPPKAEESPVSKSEEVKPVDGGRDEVKPQPDQGDAKHKHVENVVLEEVKPEEVKPEDDTKPTISEPRAATKAALPTQTVPISALTDPAAGSKAPPGYEPVHPPSRALYIRPFERPVNEAALKNYLESLAEGLGLHSTSDKVKLLYVDSIKSHAFVILNSEDSAARVLRTLNNSIWPASDKWRKPLKVDYIPEDKAQAWTDTEKRADPRGGKNIRWEVIYKADAKGHVRAFHGEEHKVDTRAASPTTQPSIRRDAVAATTTTTTAPPALTQRPRSDTQSSFKTIDQLFASVANAKPKIYFKEVPEELWRARLRELRRFRSARWDPRAVRASDEFRRYTFRGARLLDTGRHVQGPRALAREGLGGGAAAAATAGGRGGGRFAGGRRRGGYGGGGLRRGFDGVRDDDGRRGYGASRGGDLGDRERR